jgi:hypothetical protein
MPNAITCIGHFLFFRRLYQIINGLIFVKIFKRITGIAIFSLCLFHIANKATFTYKSCLVLHAEH